jgi:hypothetical protein
MKRRALLTTRTRVCFMTHSTKDEDQFLLLGMNSATRISLFVHCYGESVDFVADHFCAEGDQEGGSVL